MRISYRESEERVVAVELTSHHSIPEPKTAYQLVNRPGIGLPFSSLRDPEGASREHIRYLFFPSHSVHRVSGREERDEARRDREGEKKNQEEWYCKQCILMSCLRTNCVARVRTISLRFIPHQGL